MLRSVERAAEIIKAGGLVAFPTETVYGLGADALNPEAVAGIYAAKGRPADNPLILHIEEIDAVSDLAEEVSETAKALTDKFWPGPLTLVFKKKASLPGWVGGHPGNKMTTVAIRMPEHHIARELIRLSGRPIAAPSANKAGTPSPTCAAHVESDFRGEGVFVLDGGETAGGLESTVVDVTGRMPKVLRPGLVTEEMINALFATDSADLDRDGENIKPAAPGMKYKHYAPAAPMTLFCGGVFEISAGIILEAVKSLSSRIGILATSQTEAVYRKELNGRGNIFVLNAGDRSKPETIAHNLYARLREFDKLDVNVIFAEGVDETGPGVAIMNRLKKAAGGNIVRPGAGFPGPR